MTKINVIRDPRITRSTARPYAVVRQHDQGAYEQWDGTRCDFLESHQHWDEAVQAVPKWKAKQ